MNTPGLLARLPLYHAFRRFGWPRLLPLNLVVSVTYRCNSRCRTCNVWKKVRSPKSEVGSRKSELTVAEFGEIFRNLGPSPYYLTFSGGEPFLRRDLPDIVAAAYRHCRPAVITIPTNGLLSERIPEAVEAILRAAPGTEVGINLSLDGIGPQHDDIRGVPGNWERAMETYRALRAIEHPNLVLSIHTVISRFNVALLERVYEGLAALAPDSYINEIAEERVELGTMGADIAPTPAEYARAADFLIQRQGERDFRGFARITQAFRVQYYRLVKRILRQRRQVIPCHSGWASGHVAPDGDVWTCCIRAEPIGNLRDTGYDLRTIWFGERAQSLRRSIRAGECFCPMANASYTNMLLHPPTLARVAWALVR